MFVPVQRPPSPRKPPNNFTLAFASETLARPYRSPMARRLSYRIVVGKSAHISCTPKLFGFIVRIADRFEPLVFTTFTEDTAAGRFSACLPFAIALGKKCSNASRSKRLLTIYNHTRDRTRGPTARNIVAICALARPAQAHAEKIRAQWRSALFHSDTTTIIQRITNTRPNNERNTNTRPKIKGSQKPERKFQRLQTPRRRPTTRCKSSWEEWVWDGSVFLLISR